MTTLRCAPSHWYYYTPNRRVWIGRGWYVTKMPSSTNDKILSIVRCPHCDGAGFITVVLTYLHSSRHYHEKCEHCHGCGTIEVRES